VRRRQPLLPAPTARLAVAAALAVAIAAMALPAVAQEQPPDPQDLAAKAERRRAAAAAQLERAQAHLDDLEELRRVSREQAGDPLLDATKRQIAETMAELAEQLVGFEELRVAVADAAAETARLAKEAVEARLRFNETRTNADRQAARAAEYEAIEAAHRALDLAREQLKDTKEAAGAETALIILEAVKEGGPTAGDVVRVEREMIAEWIAAAKDAVDRAAAALKTTDEAWLKGHEPAEGTQPKPTRHRRPKSEAPRPHPRKPVSVRAAELAERARMLRENARKLDKVARRLGKDAAKAKEQDPERFPALYEAARTAWQGATGAAKEAEEAEAQAAELAGTDQSNDEPAPDAKDQPSDAADQALVEPAVEPAPREQAVGDHDPSAEALAVTGTEPAPATPAAAPDEPVVGAKVGEGATVVPPLPATAAEPDEHGLEVLPPVPASVTLPGQPGEESEEGPGKKPAATPAPTAVPVVPTTPEDGAEGEVAAMTTARPPAVAPTQPPGLGISLGNDLPGLDLPIEDRPEPDKGITFGPTGQLEPGLLLDLPEKPSEDPAIDPPFDKEPFLGEDIEKGVPDLPEPFGGPLDGPQPDKGIQFGPSGLDIDLGPLIGPAGAPGPSPNGIDYLKLNPALPTLPVLPGDPSRDLAG
jgi:hypothetical protein